MTADKPLLGDGMFNTEDLWRVAQIRPVFMHVGRLLAPDLLVQQILCEAEAQHMAPRLISVSQGLNEQISHDSVDEAARLLVLWVETGLAGSENDQRQRTATYASLRSTAIEILRSGRRLITISNRPALDWQSAESSLYLDSRALHPPSLLQRDETMESKGLPRWYLKIADGLPRLLRLGLEVLHQWQSLELQDSPSKSADSEPNLAQLEESLTRALLRELEDAFIELGPELLGELEELLERLNAATTPVGIEVLGDEVRNGLIGAGLAKRNTSDKLELSTLFRDVRVRSTLARASQDRRLIPQSLSHLAEQAWMVERSIRERVGRLLLRKYGDKWVKRFSEDLDSAVSERVMERVQRMGYNHSAVKSLPNPLEWLTLGELVALINKNAWHKEMGIGHSDWEALSREVPRIRDRIAHCRLPLTNDLSQLSKWKHILAKS